MTQLNRGANELIALLGPPPSPTEVAAVLWEICSRGLDVVLFVELRVQNLSPICEGGTLCQVLCRRILCIIQDVVYC